MARNVAACRGSITTSRGISTAWRGERQHQQSAKKIVCVAKKISENGSIFGGVSSAYQQRAIVVWQRSINGGVAKSGGIGGRAVFARSTHATISLFVIVLLPLLSSTADAASWRSHQW